MKIKEKLKFVVPSLIVILIALSYFNWINGAAFKSQVVTIDKNDIQILQELKEITQLQQLDTIEENVKNVMMLIRNIFSNIEVQNIDNTEPRAGIDKVGEFRDFTITAQGEYLNQVYLLEQINNLMRSFVVINSIDANATTITLNIRIYGRTSNETQ
jgi:hypothetical protein